MLADAIAATMLIVLMAALACTVVGAIIVAVIGIIDGLISPFARPPEFTIWMKVTGRANTSVLVYPDG
jgi:hypothetical protein